MACQTRMSLLHPPLTYVFGVVFIIISLIATIANSVVLVILWMPKRISTSHKVLTSLAVSDALLGLILSPITAWQVIDTASLSNCTVDDIRAYFTVLLVGSSVMTLGVIVYDRYILLTKLTNYNTYMTKKKALILLSIAWLYPALVPILRLLRQQPYVYLAAALSILVLPLIFLLIGYYNITKAVYIQEKMLITNQMNPCIVSYSDSLSTPSHRYAINFTEENSFRTEAKHIKLGKAVAVLLLCYFCCITPLSLWLVLNIVNSSHNFIEIVDLQILYLCSMVMSQLNSCFNPIIYFYKMPDIRRGFQKLIRLVLERLH